MNFKEKVYQYYCDVAGERVDMLQKVMAALKDSAANETKSSAGDKHETALAMLQIEQANTGAQLEDALAKKNVLKKIDPALRTSAVVNGSLVKTNLGYLFLSAALGKATIDQYQIIALSPQSPLGQKLRGLKVGDTARILTMEYFIEEIQ